MLDAGSLSEQAHDDCLAHVEATIEGDLLIELKESELEWSPIQLRHLFSQPMVVWRRVSRFEVILDDRSQPVGFVDEGSWKGCNWTAIGADQAIALLRRTGWTSGEIEALDEVVEGPGGCVELRVRDRGRSAGEQELRARINAATMKVISLVPEGAVTP